MAVLSASGAGRTACRAISLAGGITLLAGVACAQNTAGEYAVKAAFLYNFAKFVTWPGNREESGPFRICVHRPDPFGDLLDTMLGGKTIGERPVEVRRVREGDDLRPCHILFLGREAPVADALRRAGAGVLTVGEGDGFLDAGGVIGLMLRDNRVRFAVNAAAAQRAGLRISSQLLKLATEVREAGPSGS